MQQRGTFAAVLLLILFGLAGCSDAPEVVPVTGTVTRGGQPVVGATVNFMPANGRPSWAMTDSLGHYELQYSKQYEGGLIGKHTVSINFMDPNPDGTPLVMTKEKREIAEKYGSAVTTPLKVEIKESDQVVDFKLD